MLKLYGLGFKVTRVGGYGDGGRCNDLLINCQRAFLRYFIVAVIVRWVIVKFLERCIFRQTKINGGLGFG